MFSESTLRELLNFSANDPVVSVYLNTEPSKGNADAHRARLRSLLKEVSLKQDTEAIEEFFNHSYDWSGRSVAVFSSAPAGFFHFVRLSMPVEDELTIGPQPEIKPLLSLMDNYGGYGVVLIDKQNARLFLFQQRELVEQQAISGEAVKHIKTGSNILTPPGGPQARSRTLDEVIERNMRELAELVMKDFDEKHVRRMIIGGSEENVAAFKGQLSKAWLSLVVGTFSISMNASLPEVLEKSISVNRKVEMEREDSQVEALVTSAAKESAAVVGLEDTLEAVSQGKVKTLVFTEGASAPGYWHRDCGLLTSLAIKKHHACPEPAVRVEDVIGLAATAVLKGGGDVEVVHPGTALDEHGKVGALLRY
jgi:peptide subunit release factor 1 (eRF1)